MISQYLSVLALILLSSLTLLADGAPAPITLELWPAGAPGETGTLPPEKDLSKPNEGLVAGQPLIRLGNVSKPTLEIRRPPADKNTGAAVLVCPGGAYHILAMDLEGTEVCDWLNSVGVTAALLKYRVPRRAGLEKHTAPLQDAQRALGLLRQKADELGLRADRIGVLGFSAGGHLSAALSTHPERTYPAIDESDRASCRPDFAVLIYPAYLTGEKADPAKERVAPELPLSTNAPPTFLAIAQDDPVRVENAVIYAMALNSLKVPMELHLYPTGGHGYGLRKSSHAVTSWPDRVQDWMRGRKILP